MWPLDIQVAERSEVQLLPETMVDRIQIDQATVILVPVQVTGIIQEITAAELINLHHQDLTHPVLEVVLQE